ncbi:MAG TPA: glutaredoxin family protein [Propionibacteriaceae bacterium]|nr:glutaredoxin family protein [Propionibacteriaceae bacterium]HPZ50174.1 glutaredoxin family protein [Propionibacteriaceae bacterium]HQE30413.1 glutaredoxin family protein [Propionibacteriaceae bacterium]
MTIPGDVVVLVREGCHLCDDALGVIAEVCADAGRPWTAIDVDSNPELKATYTDHVPVTFVDGDVLSFWFVDRDQLAAALVRA